MEKLRKNKGITLIALVITIIVLLILAGVTIATLTGDNGILTKTNNAKAETTKARAKEQAQIAVMGSYGEDGKLNYNELKTNLEKIGVTGLLPETETYPLTVKIDGECIEIRADGTVSEGFDIEEWDRTATPEECFIWESDTEEEETYNNIIGYTEKLQSYTVVRIPSRCKKIICDSNRYPIVDYTDEQAGRQFLKNVKKVILPSTVVEIGYYAFGNLHNVECGIEEIEIPDSVVSIGSDAFHGCTNLTSITIPSSVSFIGYAAFGNWTSSQTINIQGYSSAPLGWNSNWQWGCSATINWNQ